MAFDRMCALLAARQCYHAGQTVRQIAASARKSQSTVRRWLRKSGANYFAHARAREARA